VESKESKTLEGGNRTKESRDIEEKGARGTRVTNTEEYKKDSEIPWANKLLLMLYYLKGAKVQFKIWLDYKNL